MTVGEKIQYYRKQYGLSQDELGQKLLVSRQTISQWENDQTIPTIDNLLRLKEIFGVSVDELLGEEPVSTQQEEDKEKPFEEYTQILTPENFAQMKKYFFSKVTRTLFLSLSAITMISLVYILFNPPEEKPLLSFLVYALCITAILLLFYFLTRFRINKAWKKQNAQLLGATHEYKLYNGYLTVTMYKNSEFSGMAKL